VIVGRSICSVQSPRDAAKSVCEQIAGVLGVAQKRGT
jgi:hypothetical protein